MKILRSLNMNKIVFDRKELEVLCSEIRNDIFKIVRKAGSGHLGGCSSSVELLTSLYFGGLLNYNPEDPFDDQRDRVLVRGHLGPLRYKIFSMLGWIDPSELDNYRKLGSRLQGHEDKDLVPGVDITPSGSLGMLLSYGVGAAIAIKRKGNSSKVIVFLGDGEEQEGNVAEAARHVSTLSLDNIICILDKNKKQLSHPTIDVDQGDIKKIWEGYGWDVKEIQEGHNLAEINKTIRESYNAVKPVFIIANTLKGKGIPGCEDNYCGFHTISRCPAHNLEVAINSGFVKKRTTLLPHKSFEKSISTNIEMNVSFIPPEGCRSLELATDGYLRSIDKMINSEGRRFYFMTADLDDTEYIKNYKFSDSTRFIDVGLREQHLLASAYGITLTDPDSRIWIHAGDAFLYRSSDQLNAISQGGGRMIILSERAGIGQNRNGSSHQSSGQPGVVLTMPGIIFLEPADVEDLFNCYNFAFSKYPGPIYIRHHPMNIDNLPNYEDKNIDNYIVNLGKGKPKINIVGSGMAMGQVVNAVKNLESEGISARLINIINPKNMNGEFVKRLESSAPILTLYNGNPRILEYAVARACIQQKGFVSSGICSYGFEIGTSGTTEDLFKRFSYDSEGIGRIVKRLIS